MQSHAYNATSEKNKEDYFTFDLGVPVVALVSPANAYDTTSTTVTFIFNVTDTINTNCSLILDGAIINFNSSVNVSGGDNVFSNSTSVGTHTWSVNCTDANNNIGNSSSRTFTISETPTTVTTPSGGGSLTTNIGELGGTATNRLLYRSQSITFRLNNELHKITLKKLLNNSATIIIYSEPKEYTFLIGEEREFELNNDNYSDLYVKLNSIRYNTFANFTLKAIHKPLLPEVETPEKTVGEETQEEYGQYEKTYLTISKLLPLIIFLIVLALLARKARKKRPSSPKFKNFKA
jgi:hypothetical protein